jgi:hypothetical protein
MCTRRPNWFVTPFSTISSVCKKCDDRGLVLYPAFEQWFFIDSIVLLLFRAATRSRRLHSALNGRTEPFKNPYRSHSAVRHRIGC